MKKKLIICTIALVFAPAVVLADAYSGVTNIITTVNNTYNITLSPVMAYPYGFAPYYVPSYGFYTDGLVFNSSTPVLQSSYITTVPVAVVGGATTMPALNNSSNSSSTSNAIAGQAIQQQSQGGPYTSASQSGNTLTDSILGNIFSSGTTKY